MIIRVMGEGQFNVADVDEEQLQTYDNEVEKAVADKDLAHVQDALTRLREFVLEHATPVDEDYLGPSDIVIPYADANLEDIDELLTGEGFIPDLT